MRNDFVERLHSVLEDWARLEKLVLDVRGTDSIDLSRSISKILDAPFEEVSNARLVRNKCAHLDSKLSTTDIEAFENFILLYVVPRKEIEWDKKSLIDSETWLSQSCSSRLLRHRYLSLYVQVLDDAREYEEIPFVINAYVSPFMFKKVRSMRDVISHPSPPPKALDVEQLLTELVNWQAVLEEKELVAAQAKRALEEAKLDKMRVLKEAALQAIDDEFTDDVLAMVRRGADEHERKAEEDRIARQLQRDAEERLLKEQQEVELLREHARVADLQERQRQFDLLDPLLRLWGDVDDYVAPKHIELVRHDGDYLAPSQGPDGGTVINVTPTSSLFDDIAKGLLAGCASLLFLIVQYLFIIIALGKDRFWITGIPIVFALALTLLVLILKLVVMVLKKIFVMNRNCLVAAFL